MAGGTRRRAGRRAGRGTRRRGAHRSAGEGGGLEHPARARRALQRDVAVGVGQPHDLVRQPGELVEEPRGGRRRGRPGQADRGLHLGVEQHGRQRIGRGRVQARAPGAAGLGQRAELTGRHDPGGARRCGDGDDRAEADARRVVLGDPGDGRVGERLRGPGSREAPTIRAPARPSMTLSTTSLVEVHVQLRDLARRHRRRPRRRDEVALQHRARVLDLIDEGAHADDGRRLEGDPNRPGSEWTGAVVR